ncbi:hypothetical protein [Streptomyces roseochromogenus]|uniref:Uncharacterized protein n=1 Tax=Streptomyces roseochromogenus subsp. oscitans DS 12.976 TaxID=1352936 RepID=V6KWE0_STRRC|nr:hypothetical protein [Streptomyces roseochromogenus]EST36338.1 hypothetical protein M878_02405 [Streptomyces roseochromogenus subsp. oscitans DS 12.976]
MVIVSAGFLGTEVAAVARGLGVEVRTGAAVTGILSDAGGVTGVRLADATGSSVVPGPWNSARP